MLLTRLGALAVLTSAAIAATCVVHGLTGAAGATAAPDSAMLDPSSLGVLPPVALPALLGSPPTPDQDDFYRPPHDFERAEPGHLLRYRSSRAYLAPGTPAPARAWQVLYRSTTARDHADVVSGTVLLPDTPWLGRGPRPIIGYAVGTHGLGDQCAPSYEMATGTDLELTIESLALARGWAVAITDYEGLGTPGDHTYTVATSEGRGVLDIVRAAHHLPDAGVAPDAPVGIWGYSQGGGAAASAGEQAKDYAPELGTVGVAEGGVPGNLRAVLAGGVNGGPVFPLLAGALAGFDTAYPHLGIPHLLNAAGRGLLDQMRHECAAQFTKQAGGRLDEYTRSPGLLNYPPLRQALHDNSLGDHSPHMPVLLYWAQLDEIIPLSVTQQLLADYCRHGVRIQYTEIPGVNHETGGLVGASSAVNWLAARFAHQPAPCSCS